MGKTPEQLYEEREKRVKDVIALKVPDRVPVCAVWQAFPCYHYGITMKEASSNYDKAEELYDLLYQDFQPDLAFSTILLPPSNVYEILGLKWLKWPGHGIDDNSSIQYLEDEYMKAEEYDELISDPTKFFLTKYLPYSFKGLEGFRYLGSFRNSAWSGWSSAIAAFGNPEVQESIRCAEKAAEELKKWFASLAKYRGKLKIMGFPPAFGTSGYAPFDMLADTLRGTIPALMDMRRRPQQLLEAIDALTPICIESIKGAKAAGVPYIWMWLHKGIDSFMSQKQFEKFYWPSLRKVVEAYVEADCVPVLYGEGCMDNRYEAMSDMPKGKMIFHLEKADMVKAKKILGDVCCISGNISNTLLQFGTPEQVKEECKKLIDCVGVGGGYIMDTSALLDEAKFENVKVMFEFTQSYGVYN